MLEVHWVSKNLYGDTSGLWDLIRSECFQKDTEVFMHLMYNLIFGVQSVLLADFSWTLYVILGIVDGAQKSLPQVPFGYSGSENLG